MNAFFAMQNRMKHIKRWGLMRNTLPEDVQQHTAQCAMLAHALAVIGNRRLGRHYDANAVAVLALYHEAAEVLTGDLATPVKYFDPEIRQAYRRIEDTASQKLLDSLPQDLQTDYQPLLFPAEDEAAVLVKAADRLCAYLKCAEELKMGNHEFASAHRANYDALTAMNCPEADIFLREFAPAFSLSLDELTLG